MKKDSTVALAHAHLHSALPTWIFAHFLNEFRHTGNLLVKLSLHLVKHVDELLVGVLQARIDLALYQIFLIVQGDLLEVSMAPTEQQASLTRRKASPNCDPRQSTCTACSTFFW